MSRFVEFVGGYAEVHSRLYIWGKSVLRDNTNITEPERRHQKEVTPS